MKISIKFASEIFTSPIGKTIKVIAPQATIDGKEISVVETQNIFTTNERCDCGICLSCEMGKAMKVANKDLAFGS